MLTDVAKVFLPAVLSFALGIGLTPLLAHYLYAHKMWKKRAGKVGLDGTATKLFNRLHEAREVGTPRLGGIIIWLSTALSIGAIFLVAQMSESSFLMKLDFLSRDQTWIPLSLLILGALVGLIDDFFEIKGPAGNGTGGLSLFKRLFLVGAIGLLVGIWFYSKLDVAEISVPFFGALSLGPLLIPFFALVTMATYSGGIIDGIDGLAGGIFAVIFGAYGVIAFFQDQINLAAFCAALLGGILAFLWFNIPPARFYMSETGSMALTLTLSVVAFMTDALGEGNGVLVLPIVAFPLVLTSASVILQTVSKKIAGRKIFRIAPIHHHFEALGWPPYKVVMRYWVLAVIFALIGVTIALVG